MTSLKDHITVLTLILFLGISVSSCKTGLNIDHADLTAYDLIDYTPKNNPTTTEKITLGKRLFFDQNLSSNQQVSCATCHLPEKAFTDGTRLSPLGVTKQNQTRNAPPLFNLAYHNSFFWDGGKTTLENQSFSPLRNSHEMNADLDSVISYLNTSKQYLNLFKDAFNTLPSKATLAKALASYERSLLSFNSKYDHIQKGSDHFTTQEKKGLILFKKNCQACHRPPLFTDLFFHNNGLDSIFGKEFDDHKNGRYRITSNKKDIGKYKTPSLRNLRYTSPYMHDGRFVNLNEVLKNYSSPVMSSTIDPRISHGIKFSTSEKNQLLAFIETLNDENFVLKN